MGHVLENLIWRAEVAPDRKLLLLALAKHADSDAVTFPGVPLLARETGLTTRGVEKMLGVFVTGGVLTIVERGNGRGHTNKYRINALRLQNPEPYSGFVIENPELETGNTENPEPETPNEKRGIDVNPEPYSGIPPAETVAKPRTSARACKEQPLKELNNISETNVSGADAPNHAQAIWKQGVSLLTSAGESEKSARSFLGGLIKKHTAEEVAKALAATSVKGAAEPKAYLVKVLENSTKGGGNAYSEELKRRAIRDKAGFDRDWKQFFQETQRRRGKVGTGVSGGGSEGGDSTGETAGLYAPP